MFAAFDSALQNTMSELIRRVYYPHSEKTELLFGEQRNSTTESLIYCLSRNPPLNSDVLLEKVNENMRLRGKREVSRGWMWMCLDALERTKMTKRVGPFVHRKYTIKNTPKFLSKYVEDIVEKSMADYVDYGYHSMSYIFQ